MAKRSPFRRGLLWWLFFGLASLWFGGAAVGEPLENRRVVTTPIKEGCGERLDAAMWDLQAAVTGPLADEDYERIRAIFSSLCRAAPVDTHEVDDSGRRITTRGLQNESVRSQRHRTQGPQTIDPVVFIDLNRGRQRPAEPPPAITPESR